MTRQKRNPGSALHRATGVKRETDLQCNFQLGAYLTCTDLQSRYLQRRCGLSRHRSDLIAALHFGETGR